jgi:putative ABC transport system permease protein
VRIWDALRFATGTLRSYRLRSGLIMLAMAVGVMGVVILTWLGNAARVYITGEFASLGTNMVVVLPGRSETTGGAPPVLGETARDLTLDDALAVQRSPAVALVAPVVAGTAPVAVGRLDREATILGTTPEVFEIRHLHMARGRSWPTGDPRRARSACVLGATMKEELFGGQPAINRWVRIGDRRYRVVGVIASRGRSIGLDLEEIVVIPVASAQALFDSPALFRILVKARSRDAVSWAERDIVRIIKERHQGEEDVTLITQDAVLSTFDRILHTLTLAVASIASVSLVVAGILVMNVMVVAVSQRREEIGLLKALGASPAQIRNLFLAEAALMSMGGASVGLLLGQGGTFVVSDYYPLLQAGAPAWVLAPAFLVALVTGLVFGVAPARRAARLDPVLALSRR